MAELHHECGIVAIYHLPNRGVSPLLPSGDVNATARVIPRMLLDVQNRGQLAAGMTSYNPARNQIIDTYKDVGTVAEVFRMNQPDACSKLMDEYSGTAAIGHVRYATCGKDDRSYAQPFERHHIEKSKWFSFAFNGQLANYVELREEILSQTDFHLARETDTEIIMHSFCRELAGDRRPTFPEMLSTLAKRFDGAYNIVYLNALGEMFVARDPLGFRPLCYAIEGPLFAAASESVALTNLGFKRTSIQSLKPGTAIVIRDDQVSFHKFAGSPRTAHCFFEWIYFANVASTLDERSVYMTRKALGEELAELETVALDDDTIVVPVPDTAKAAADAMAYQLKVPCLEGLIRNRYVGRTFIEGKGRNDKAKMKYTPLPEVLAGKKVILVEDTIVRSTTMRTLISQIRDRGGAKEVHVRVACPPIISPCFYGIDMSTVQELFAARHLQGSAITPEKEAEMARSLGADSLRYLPMESISRAIGTPRDSLCQACIDERYPTSAGRRLYQLAIDNAVTSPTTDSLADSGIRTYESTALQPART